MDSLEDVLADERGSAQGYVYYLCDPRTPRHPRYVGSTKAPEQREREHARLSHGRDGLRAWKRELRAVGLLPRLVVLSAYADRLEATEREWRLICRWQRRGLCDLNTGREGSGQRFDLYCDARHARRRTA